LTLSALPHAADKTVLSAPENARLLVVDDVEENRDLLQRRLTRRGYDVSVASDGEIALKALEGGDFDLVLLDIMMPGMDGLETLEHLRRTHERGTLPVIMVSARSDSADMVKALELGANDYITKPINFSVALARIATHLTLKRADDVLRRQLYHALEREQVATKLRESEEFARLIADNMPLIISYFDADKIIRFINQVAVEWHDRPREEIIGKPLAEDIFGPDTQRQDLRMQRALGGEPQTFDKAVTFPDGKFREVTISYIPHTNEAGNVVGFFGIVQDNTQRLEIERQLNQVQKMDAIGQLTGGIAHDFNNMLMVTDGNVRLALKNIDDPTTVQDTLEEVLIGTDRAAKLTKQLLSFSRRQIMENRVFRVEDSISEIKDMLRKSTGERYRLDIKNFAEGACVETDSSEFQQALINLVINARDAMPKGGLIEITSRIVELDEAAANAYADLSPGRFVEVSVRDNGEGMTESTAAHIFEPFFTTKEPGKGTGLGLAMVYGFAQSSKGSVEVESTLGAGATFNIYLPAVDRVPQINVAEIERDHLAQGETILLVEDDPALLKIVREILDTLGYNVLTAGDGFDALEVEADHDATIDLLLSDVVMPNMGGFEAAEIIREDHPDIKIVFMSGYPNRAGISTDNLPDNCQFLQKPVKPEYLARILRQELDKPSPPSLDLSAEEGTYDHA
jgi:PAS domain S-box-containing protein